MTMSHIQWANNHPKAMAMLARLNNPQQLAEMAKRKCEPVFALASIAARAYWLQINGQWIKR